jgi:hypothetical protein
MSRLVQSQSEIFHDLEMIERGRGVRQMARGIFINRNAQGWNAFGMPKQERIAIKDQVRPSLRCALSMLRLARKVLRDDGDVQFYEHLFDKACKHYAYAEIAMYRPYAVKYGDGLLKFAKRSGEGGKKKAEAMELEKPELAELDGLIRACLKRGDRPRVKEWIGVYGISRSAIYRRIQGIKSDAP